MSYQVLARTFRPHSFDTVVGQEHILKALINALQQNRMHHAYLFSGTRGVGKTTIARILAKCLNCETGVTPTPCGKCDACIEIDNGRFIDLYEIDAASRTKVEDTRDLLDNVKYLPTKARYKIYLIDEVHMLSSHSFNALLKTLEEPPSHVIFLLATTDPERLPVTVLSRCLQFNLKTISLELIEKHLGTILQTEKIAYEEEALHQLAIAAKGSVRDALSMLDQAIAFSNHNLTAEEIRLMLGTIESGYIFQLLEALNTNNAQEIINLITKLSELAADFAKVLDDLLTIIHKISLLQAIPNLGIADWDYAEKISNLAKNFTPEDLQLYYQIGIIGKRDLLLAPTPKIGFEMTMLRMLSFTLETISIASKPDTQQTVRSTKKALESTAIINKVAQGVNIAHQVAHQKDNKDFLDPAVKPRDDNCVDYKISRGGSDIGYEASRDKSDSVSFDLSKLSLTGPTAALTKHCLITSLNQTQVELLLDPGQAPLLNKKHAERLTQAFSSYFNRPLQVTITLGDQNMATAANIAKKELTQKQMNAIKSINEDYKINELIKTFDAKIIPDSIK